MEWIYVWAGQVITKYHVGPSGLTAYEGMTGLRAKHGVCGLGEYAHFAITLDTTNVDNEMPVYSRGICLGVILSTTEHLVAAQGEIFKCRSVKRLTEDLQYHKDRLREVKINQPKC